MSAPPSSTVARSSGFDRLRAGLNVVTRRAQRRRADGLHFVVEMDQEGLNEATVIYSVDGLRHLLFL